MLAYFCSAKLFSLLLADFKSECPICRYTLNSEIHLKTDIIQRSYYPY